MLSEYDDKPLKYSLLIELRILYLLFSLSGLICCGLIITVFAENSAWLKALTLATLVVFCVLISILVGNAVKVKSVKEKTERMDPASLIPVLQETESGKEKTPEKELIYSEKFVAISKFASVVSHELRNLLATFKNISYFLSKTIQTQDERTNKMLRMLSSEIDRTNDIVTNLMNMSHIRKIGLSAVKLDELLNQTVEQIKLPGNISMSKEVQPIKISADPEKIKIAVINLLTNAVDATAANGGTIFLSLKKTERGAEITVSDTGCGMDNETLEKIFEPMFSTKTKVLGMGLTMVNEIIKMHRGTIEVTSEKGKGSTFSVILPF